MCSVMFGCLFIYVFSLKISDWCVFMLVVIFDVDVNVVLVIRFDVLLVVYMLVMFVCFYVLM